MTFDLCPDLFLINTFSPCVSHVSPPSPVSLILSFLQAKVDNEIIDYKDLAAIPRVKAIYDIERPDMISYESLHSTSSTLERKGRHSSGEVTRFVNIYRLSNKQTMCYYDLIWHI